MTDQIKNLLHKRKKQLDKELYKINGMLRFLGSSRRTRSDKGKKRGGYKK